MSMILSGCEQKNDVDPNEIDVSFEKDIDEFYQKAVSGGYSLGGPTPGSMKTIVDIANIKLLYANYKSSKELQTAIEEFNRSSTALANKMLYLTIVIAVLTFIMAILTAAQVSKPVWRFLVWMHNIVGSFAHSYIQKFAKTETGTTSPVKQYEGGNKSKDSSEKTPREEPEADRMEDED